MTTSSVPAGGVAFNDLVHEPSQDAVPLPSRVVRVVPPLHRARELAPTRQARILLQATVESP